jgi:hypothetical protein
MGAPSRTVPEWCGAVLAGDVVGGHILPTEFVSDWLGTAGYPDLLPI